ncbi:MAG: hypothetical protein P8R54_13900 [Myxococcota bacterium]|nr:hypothetical protein [Myxococcota bacterium]
MNAHFRAILITIHLAALMLLATPNPSMFLRRSLWDLPMAQAELVAWADMLSGMGIEHTPDSLEEALWDGFQQLGTIRKKLTRPLRPYVRYCGTAQDWPLFAIPQRKVSRLFIDILQDEEEWETIYITQDPDVRWNHRRLNSERYRNKVFFISQPHKKRQYRKFAGWIAGMAASDFPEADKIRLRFHVQTTLGPKKTQRGERPEGEFTRELILSLSPHR